MSVEPAPNPGSIRAAVAPTERLMSLDALRGFDMMWIVGADALGHALAKLDAGPLMAAMAAQLDHVKWEGFRFYDLIFPLFVFMIGVAITFSLGRLVEREGTWGALTRVGRRTLLLYLLGLFYYGGLSKGFEEIRWLGVLQRLALCYGMAGCCFVLMKPRGWVTTVIALLVGYWALLTFVPVPGIGAGDYSEGRNLTNWIDKEFLPGHRWDGDHDPEGILSTFPAVASCLLGMLAGHWLKDTSRSGEWRAGGLAAAGLVLIAVGHLWGLQFPVIKKLWTSSYVLVAGGWSALLMAGFYFAIDVKGVRGWAVPFTWVGTNALTIYMISKLVDFDDLSARLVGKGAMAWLDTEVMPNLSGVVIALVGLVLCFLLCRFLYRRQIFLRL